MPRTIDTNELDELYAVADDYEADILDGLRRKAGHTWDCYRDDRVCWTNLASDTNCGNCGRARPV